MVRGKLKGLSDCKPLCSNQFVYLPTTAPALSKNSTHSSEPLPAALSSAVAPSLSGALTSLSACEKNIQRLCMVIVFDHCLKCVVKEVGGNSPPSSVVYHVDKRRTRVFLTIERTVKAPFDLTIVYRS